MWKRISLRTRILVLLAALVAITVGGALISLVHTYMVDRIFSGVFETDLEGLQAAQELESALLMQRGYVSYFYQDGDPEWLSRLEREHRSFEDRLKRCRARAVTAEERGILNEIESRYIRYSYGRDEVLRLYNEGKREEGLKLHHSNRELLFGIVDLCNQFKMSYDNSIALARENLRMRVRLTNIPTLVGLFFATALAAVLAYVLNNQVMGPIRQLAMPADGRRAEGAAEDEVSALSRRFQNLIEDVDQTRDKLKWSTEHLEQAGKWALVGKLAAGVAHSVRNPLTSVKMRLFSMERSLAPTDSQKEDFGVISEEIRHIDGIVRHFLEFARPPKLKTQTVSPSDAVDMTIQLLRYRLESYDVKVEIVRDHPLPAISVDPDQLKEVLVNLVVNACEAMINGGSIVIREEEGFSDELGPTAVIRVQDNGPGVPESIQQRLFQPFFSTKEEGTGLGLSIATRIVEDHGGWLDLVSREGHGATFIITLPVKGRHTWEES